MGHPFQPDDQPPDDHRALYVIGGATLMLVGAGLILSRPEIRHAIGRFVADRFAQVAEPWLKELSDAPVDAS